MLEGNGYSYMKGFILEVCVDSTESAAEAVQGGATRLELCANLVIGGTTPSIFLFKEIRKFSNIPIHAIVRPRFGDFCNTESELRIMAEEIRQFKDIGVEGVVTGVLLPDGSVDLVSMEMLRNVADGMHFTMHRAFDMCKKPLDAIKQLEGLGVDTVLTSGQKSTCLDGLDLIKKLANLTKVDVMAGSGLTPDSVRQIRAVADLTSYHLSGKVEINSPMAYRNADVNMGLPSLSEYDLWRTDAKRISEIRKILEEPVTQ